MGGIEQTMELLGRPVQEVNRLIVLLIVNLTQSESGARRLLQVSVMMHVSILNRLIVGYKLIFVLQYLPPCKD